MEYNQKDFYKMQGATSAKMPFYMTYPMQNVFLEEAEYERDMERLKSMYPKEVRDIQELVEEECDKMEYEGSMMFDEVPDRLMLRQICQRICNKIMEQEQVNTIQNIDFEAEQYEDVEMKEHSVRGQQWGDGRPPMGLPPFRPPVGSPDRPPQHRPPQNRPNNGLHNLVEVLLFHEMYNRRCRHRRCRRWW